VLEEKFNINKSTNQMQQSLKFITCRYIQLNMFRVSLRPSSGAQQLQYQPPVLPLVRGGSSAVGRFLAGRPDHDQQHCYHHGPRQNQRLLKHLYAPDDGVEAPETC
jgi:hypothetical protein